ncbi:hypothetical protein QUF80_18865 [Desulfococcaceae bacterium HSG8]|nr:hypothetical protein [Desulfococcaceae bacterium HSG8]
MYVSAGTASYYNTIITVMIISVNRKTQITDAGNLTVSYVYGDDLISQNRNGEIRYYHYDGHGHLRLRRVRYGTAAYGHHGDTGMRGSSMARMWGHNT